MLHTTDRALDVCCKLIAAYEDGERNGGSMEWSAVDEAHEAAKEVLRGETQRRRLYGAALQKWGADLQLTLVTEECAELIQLVSHVRRGRSDHEEMLAEAADVSIMVDQLRYIFGEGPFDRARERKLWRLKFRLQEDGADLGREEAWRECM